jgi:hypothetical protein
MVQATEKASKWKIARSFPRFAIDLPVTISGGKLAATIPAKIVDIGLGGLCAILTEGQVRSGDRLQLTFVLPKDSGPVVLMAKLKYVIDQRHGFQFLTITPEQRERIRRVCENLPIV